MLLESRRLLERAARWLLRNRPGPWPSASGNASSRRSAPSAPARFRASSATPPPRSPGCSTALRRMSEARWPAAPPITRPGRCRGSRPRSAPPSIPSGLGRERLSHKARPGHGRPASTPSSARSMTPSGSMSRASAFQQQSADVEMSPGYRKEQGGSALSVGCFEIRSRTQMEPYRFHRTCEHGDPECWTQRMTARSCWAALLAVGSAEPPHGHVTRPAQRAARPWRALDCSSCIAAEG